MKKEAQFEVGKTYHYPGNFGSFMKLLEIKGKGKNRRHVFEDNFGQRYYYTDDDADYLKKGVRDAE